MNLIFCNLTAHNGVAIKVNPAAVSCLKDREDNETRITFGYGASIDVKGPMDEVANALRLASEQPG